MYKSNLQVASEQQGDIALFTTLQYIPHFKAEVFNSVREKHLISVVFHTAEQSPQHPLKLPTLLYLQSPQRFDNLWNVQIFISSMRKRELGSKRRTCLQSRMACFYGWIPFLTLKVVTRVPSQDLTQTTALDWRRKRKTRVLNDWMTGDSLLKINIK